MQQYLHVVLSNSCIKLVQVSAMRTSMRTASRHVKLEIGSGLDRAGLSRGCARTINRVGKTMTGGDQRSAALECEVSQWGRPQRTVYPQLGGWLPWGLRRLAIFVSDG